MNDKHETQPSTVHTLSQSCGKASRTRETKTARYSALDWNSSLAVYPSRKGISLPTAGELGSGSAPGMTPERPREDDLGISRLHMPRRCRSYFAMHLLKRYQ